MYFDILDILNTKYISPDIWFRQHHIWQFGTLCQIINGKWFALQEYENNASGFLQQPNSAVMEIRCSVNLSLRFLNHDCDYLHLCLTNKVIAMNLQIIQPHLDHSYSLFFQLSPLSVKTEQLWKIVHTRIWHHIGIF